MAAARVRSRVVLVGRGGRVKKEEREEERKKEEEEGDMICC